MDASGLAASDASETEWPIVRPGFRGFVWYCYGGRLAEQNHSWVLRDVTCSTWVLRHFARWIMVIVPVFFLFLAFMPMPFGPRLLTDLAICGGIFMFALVNLMIDTDRRAVRAGYRFSLPGEIRGKRAADRQRHDNRERGERIAERASASHRRGPRYKTTL